MAVAPSIFGSSRLYMSISSNTYALLMIVRVVYVQAYAALGNKQHIYTYYCIMLMMRQHGGEARHQRNYSARKHAIARHHLQSNLLT